MVSSRRSGAVKLSLGVVAGLVVLKMVAAVITGSLSVTAQAADSFLDLIAILITFFAVGVAMRPADREHPFGHGKVEGFSAIAQAALIFTAAGLVIYSAIRRLVTGGTVELTEAGIGVMLVSIIVSIFLSRYLLKVSRTTGSIALEANARNIAADVYSAGAVLAGLVAVRLTGLNILDPIIALLVVLFILKAGYDVVQRSFGELVDVRLPEAEEAEIKACIIEHYSEVVSFHGLRTRRAGGQRYIDLHLVMPQNASVEKAHRMCDHLEQDIEDRLPNTSVTIHVEPCNIECERCSVTCSLRRGSR